MFNNRRSKIEIVSEILTLSRGGVKKTTILYQNNLKAKIYKWKIGGKLDFFSRKIKKEA